MVSRLLGTDISPMILLRYFLPVATETSRRFSVDVVLEWSKSIEIQIPELTSHRESDSDTEQIRAAGWSVNTLLNFNRAILFDDIRH